MKFGTDVLLLYRFLTGINHFEVVNAVSDHCNTSVPESTESKQLTG